VETRREAALTAGTRGILLSYEEALATDPIGASWISFAQNAALGSHTYILEDGPWLRAVSGPHADEGGEILEGMYAQGCTSIEDSRIHGRSGRRPRYRFGCRVNVFCSGKVYSETMPTKVITYYAISEGVTVQGIKDPRGTTGSRCSQTRLGGLTK
jgi:hypothetical protein